MTRIRQCSYPRSQLGRYGPRYKAHKVWRLLNADATMGTTGLHVVHDTGVPDMPADYTTLILIHGYVWNSGMSQLSLPLDSGVLSVAPLEIFSKLIPVVKAQGTRLLLVNRRDYPGSIPYTEEELEVLPASASTADGDHLSAIRLNLLSYMRARAREVYDFLEELVHHDQVPPANPKENTGGIVIAGWSFGSVWMLAVLAFASSFPTTDVYLSKYVRRVVCYGELWSFSASSRSLMSTTQISHMSSWAIRLRKTRTTRFSTQDWERRRRS